MIVILTHIGRTKAAMLLWWAAGYRFLTTCVCICTHYRITDARHSNGKNDNTRPQWLPEQEPDPQSSSASDADDEGEDDDEVDPSPHPAAENDPLPMDRSHAQKTEYDESRRAVYHVMQLGAGAGKKALNPWFKAFLASVIDSWPGISTNDFQRTWFDLTEEERNLDYRWELAGRPEDDGFAAGFKLPEGKELPAVGLLQNTPLPVMSPYAFVQ